MIARGSVAASAILLCLSALCRPSNAKSIAAETIQTRKFVTATVAVAIAVIK